VRVGRDGYWKAIAAAVNRLPRSVSEPQIQREAERLAGTYDALDILKWTNGLPAVGPGHQCVLQDFIGTLESLAADCAFHDISDFDRLGHMPYGAPPDTYELSKGDYWDGIQEFLALAQRNRVKRHYPDTDDALLSALEQTVYNHPFTQWPRSLDVIRLSPNLVPALGKPAWKTFVSEVSRYWRGTAADDKRMAFALMAQVAMVEDAYRMATSIGMFVPNAFRPPLTEEEAIQQAREEAWARGEGVEVPTSELSPEELAAIDAVIDELIEEGADPDEIAELIELRSGSYQPNRHRE
jgi:hypothetical protein